MTKKTIRIATRVDVSMKEFLYSEADKLGITASEYVRRIIKEKMNEKRS